jgi:hypothetical protein
MILSEIPSTSVVSSPQVYTSNAKEKNKWRSLEDRIMTMTLPMKEREDANKKNSNNEIIKFV